MAIGNVCPKHPTGKADDLLTFASGDQLGVSGTFPVLDQPMAAKLNTSTLLSLLTIEQI